jgi:hypothetical protein
MVNEFAVPPPCEEFIAALNAIKDASAPGTISNHLRRYEITASGDTSRSESAVM